MREIVQDIAREIVHNTVHEIVHDIAREIVHDTAREIVHDTVRKHDTVRAIVQDIAREIVHNTVHEIVRGIVREIVHDIMDKVYAWLCPADLCVHLLQAHRALHRVVLHLLDVIGAGTHLVLVLILRNALLHRCE